MTTIIRQSSNTNLSLTYYNKTKEFFINDIFNDVYLTKNKHKARLIRDTFNTISNLIESKKWDINTIISFSIKVSKYSYTQLKKYLNNLSKLLK